MHTTFANLSGSSGAMSTSINRENNKNDIEGNISERFLSSLKDSANMHTIIGADMNCNKFKDDFKTELKVLGLFTNNSDFLKELKKNDKTYHFHLKMPNYVSAKTNKYKNHIPNSSVLIKSKTIKNTNYPTIRTRNDFLYWNRILLKNKKINLTFYYQVHFYLISKNQ